MKSKKKLEVSVEKIAYVVFAIAAFFGIAGISVLDWDLLMFHGPSAPFTFGLGVSILVSVITGIIELYRDRK